MPPIEASLLGAILADPAADEPRLAYADHLALSSRASDRARAEFIRIQIELTILSDDHSRWPGLVGRERDLLEQYRTVWEKPLRDRFRPPLTAPGRWLRSHLFGSGGLWGFRRGFVEHILAPAPSFLAEDAAILSHTPIRRVVLAHASEHVGLLASDGRLDHLDSLHLVGDMEMDEDLTGLSAIARSAGLTVLEFRFPRLSPDVADLFEILRTGTDDGPPLAAADYPAWTAARPEAQDRLCGLAASPHVGLLAHDPAHEGELLALNEWVYVGDEFAEAGVWAVAKGHQDLEDEDGRCRRLVLLRPGQGESLRLSPYCFGEID